MIERTPASRPALRDLRRRLEQVQRGISLLHRKREALVGELFRRAHTVVDARAEMENDVQRAHQALLRALAAHGGAGLRSFGWPHRDLLISLEESTIWGVQLPQVTEVPPTRRDLPSRSVSLAGAGEAAIETADRFENVLQALLRTASAERNLRRLGEELRRTTRQVHGLEQRVQRTLVRELARVQQTLEEREREERLRLRHFLRRRAVPG